MIKGGGFFGIAAVGTGFGFEARATSAWMKDYGIYNKLPFNGTMKDQAQQGMSS